MKKINFLFAIHCHQPVGNFEHVIEDAYNKSYLPFISVLEKYPSVKMTVHYTGILLSWFREKHPEFLEKLKGMADRGQIEIMTGAYYEPILAVIPDRDKLGQIEKQTEFTKKHLGFSPKGLWLAERIWEPHIAKTLSEAGVEYTALDDYHFISAGLEAKDLNGYFVTEEQGASLNVFPINKNLRYLIPFKMPQETIDYLRSIATEDGSDAAVIADDGEKFGVWPGTFKWVYEERYLDNLFSMLSAESSWINTMTFSEYMEKYPSKGRIYLPAASYFEMMEWSLLTQAGKVFGEITKELRDSGRLERYKRFFKGGFWRNFFVKYPESNNMHKKMLLVSKKVWQAVDKHGSKAGYMQDELWQGQCNCAYWHGVFGGLYLNYLRHAVYEHLINAEKAADAAEHHGKKWIMAETMDFDKDGLDEVLISTHLMNLYFDPDCGGAMFELDYKPGSFNLVNTLSRKEEAYHQDVLRSQAHQMTLTGTTNGASSIHDVVRVKETGLEKLLTYDKCRKACFVDHFLAPDATLDSYSSGRYKDLGDFECAKFTHDVRYGNKQISVVMSRDGAVVANGSRHPVRVTKTVTVFADFPEIDVKWEVSNSGSEDIDIWFGVENNFSLLAGNSPDRYYEIDGKKPADPMLGGKGQSADIYETRLIDKWSGVSIIVDTVPRAGLWRFPIETVSQSEGGFERTFQNSSLLFHWKVSLKTGSPVEFSLKIKLPEGVS